MNGCATSGKFDEAKNTPDSSHIGIITMFIHPETPSMVVARVEMSSPSPENASAPSRTSPATSAIEPTGATPKAN